MFAVLRACGALAVLLPELDRLWGVPQRADYHPEVDTGLHTMLVLGQAVQQQAPLAVRWACLVHDLGKGTTPADVLPRHIGHEMRSVKLLQRVCEHWRVPRDCRELAEVVAREHGHIHQSLGLSAAATLRLLERCDAIRRPERFEEVLLACECDARGRLGFEDAPYPQAERLRRALAAVLAVETAPIAADTATRCPDPRKTGEWIAQAIGQARTEALRTACLPGRPSGDDDEADSSTA